MLIRMIDMTRGAVLPRLLCQWHQDGEDANHFACDALLLRVLALSKKARAWAGIFGGALLGIVQYITGWELTFAPTISGAIIHALAGMGVAWLLIFFYNLAWSPWIVRRRDKPLKLWSEDPLHEVVENENMIEQTVGIELENISDVTVRHCKICVTYIRPDIIDVRVPIFMRGYLSIPAGKHERILIARFMKPKAPDIASQFRLCAPVGGWNGSQFILPEKAYDITIEASCDEAQREE